MTEQQPMVAEADQQQVVAQQELPEYQGQKLNSAVLKDRKYKGEDYSCDMALQHGCVVKRHCTDVLCGLTFCVFLGAMIAVTFWGYANGSLEVSLAPINANGGFCGFNYPNNGLNDNKDYPYLYIWNLNDAIDAYNNNENFWAYGICVSECPDSNDFQIECSPQSVNIDTDCGNGNAYATYESLNYCIPEESQMDSSTLTAYTNLVSDTKSNYSADFMLDVYREKWIILMGIGFTVVYTLIYIKFMDACAICISWFSLIIIQTTLVVLGVGVFYWGKDVESSNDSSHAPWLNFLAVVFWTTACLFCICIMCNLKAMKISFAIIESAAEYFSQTKRIIIVPILFFFIGVTFFLMWLFGLVCIATAGTVVPTPYNGILTPDSTFTQQRTIVHNTASANGWYIAYMFVGLIWVSAFIVSCNDFVIIVSTITWYFSKKTDHGEEGHSSVWQGFHWIYRYQWGTLAVGSLILSLVWIIRGFFEWLGEKLHENHSENACAKCLLATCMCCLDCTDRFIRYLTENAYIYSALSSDSFCTSALHSFMLMLKNSAKFAFVASVSDTFMILAKISVSFLVVLTCWGIMSAMKSGITVEDESFGPLFVIFLVSYLVCAIFISIFHTSANTILQCFLVDRDIALQQGHIDAQHVPHTLVKFIDQYCEEADIHKDEVKTAEEVQPAPEKEAMLSEKSSQKGTF